MGKHVDLRRAEWQSTAQDTGGSSSSTGMGICCSCLPIQSTVQDAEKDEVQGHLEAISEEVDEISGDDRYLCLNTICNSTSVNLFSLIKVFCK